MKTIYAFVNYRHFMKHFYDEKRKINKSFSFTVFSKKAGFVTKSYLIEVISGKKALSKNSIFKIAEAMGLKKKETEYFEAMVLFNEAKTIKEREFYYERMRTLAGKHRTKYLGVDQYAYFSEWYHPVIRELVTMKEFNGDYKTLAKSLSPPITTKQAEQSVNLLLKLCLIKKTAGNKYRLTDVSVTTGEEVASLAVLKYSQQNIKLAGEALDRIPKTDRDISTITTSLSGECFATVKKEIQLFRKRLIRIMEEDKNQDRAYQMNFQLFPVSKRIKKDKT